MSDREKIMSIALIEKNPTDTLSLQNRGSLSCVIKSLTLETEIGLYGCDFFPSELFAPCGSPGHCNFCCWFL